MKKDEREIMEILAAYDVTGCAHSAAQLVGVDAKTVRRCVAARDRAADPCAAVERGMLIDAFGDKIDEWVDHSHGKVRTDVVHDKLVAMGFTGSDRTTCRAVAATWRAGNGRRYKPWLTEPGMWLQYDWGTGPVIGGRPTQLFCACGVVAVPGRDPGVGQDPAHGAVLCGRDVPSAGRRAKVCAD